MGGLATAVKFLPYIREGVGLITNVVSGEVSARESQEAEKQAVKDLQRQQQEHVRQLQEDAALRSQQLNLEAAENERQRKDALKRAVARQRAQFGSSGIGSASGSSNAVLLGFFDETQQELDVRARLDKLRQTAIEQNIDQQRRLNVIQLTQLRENQKLNNLSSTVGRVSNFANFSTGALDLGARLAAEFQD